ncbi:hypothetical protein D9M70_599160 [compost metagenome]
MNLLPSITEPPPMARMKSQWSRLACSTARSRVSNCGLASMPAKRLMAKPANAASTWAQTPFWKMLPPPWVTSTRLPAGISWPSLAIWPSPKWILVGL